MSNIFDDIKHKIKLLDYVSKIVKLKDVGHRHLGLCPFHYEKTPSFYVDDSSNLFYCFGCNKGGDLFSFYCLLHNCDKKEALKQLAKQAGVVRASIVKNDLNVLLDFFIMQTDHLEFLKKRGINAESISKFKLGWAPNFFTIMNFINKNHLNLSELGFKESFLKGFQNRVVFPIFNEIGMLVSFSGRILNDGAYKYINGAESTIFHKNEVLYGLNFIEKKEEIFLVEGHIDVIMMFQFSYSAVASMGTAISSDQIKMLWKYTNKIVVMMDGDSAGQKAAEKIALLALELICTGKEISFIILDEEYDPASYLNTKLKIDRLKKYALYEYLVYLKGEIPENLDKRAIYFKELNEYVELIKDFNLKIEYKKYWNSLRWKKNEKIVNDKLKIVGEDYLILLLFKYIVCYNGLLDHVAEDFLKLNMNEIYKTSLMNILNNMPLDFDFLNKINQINIEVANLNLEQVMEEWYRLYYRVQKPSEDMKKVLLDDFSEESWENYKKLLEKKDQNYNDY